MGTGQQSTGSAYYAHTFKNISNNHYQINKNSASGIQSLEKVLTMADGCKFIYISILTQLLLHSPSQ